MPTPMWNVIGHERAVEVLRRMVLEQHVPHALLLTGPAGIGKTRLSLELAKAVNCTGEECPDQTCVHCVQIEHGGHPDVGVIERQDGKDSISIEQMRALRDSAAIRPFQARMKVFVVAGADTLTLNAADALLKTLEEPQTHVMVVLTAVDAGALPTTVISRCRVLPLQAVDQASLAASLRDAGATSDDAARLARLAQGNVGWAMRAMKEPKLADAQEEMLTTLAGVLDLDLDARLALVESLTAGKRDRSAIRRVVEVLVLIGRDLLLLAHRTPARATTGEQQVRLARQAERLSRAQIHGYLQSLHVAMERIDSNVDPRLTLEALVVGLP
ncbi:MAG: DNA polymerase III subunit delta' [Chloroflexota bacterium]